MCMQVLGILLECRLGFSSLGMAPRALHFWWAPGDAMMYQQSFSVLTQSLHPIAQPLRSVGFIPSHIGTWLFTFVTDLQWDKSKSFWHLFTRAQAMYFTTRKHIFIENSFFLWYVALGVLLWNKYVVVCVNPSIVSGCNLKSKKLFALSQSD